VLVDRISSGGMADVYIGKAVGIRGFSRTVAIKRIHPHLLERQRFLRMFSDEAKIAAKLVHPNIVQIYDLGEEDGVPYIAMEYVPGRDLYHVVQRIVDRGHRCPWSFATRVVTEVCDGLQHAHDFRSVDGRAQEIVHRDVSPRNILISYKGEVKLTDFGVARARDREEETEHGVIKGKVRYISPEAAAGHQVDRRSDLYSLAIVFAEMLTMVPLRTAANDLAMLVAIRQGDIDRTKLDSLPAAIAHVLDRALSREPERRYPYAAALRDAILTAAGGDAVPMTQDELEAFMIDLFADGLRREKQRERRAEKILTEATDEESRPPLQPLADARDRPPGPAAPPSAYEPQERPVPQFEGDLVQISFARLLYRVASDQSSGQLDLRQDPLLKSLYLEHGNPVFSVSNVERELFGEHLVSHGVLTRAQHSETLDYAALEGLSFLDALLRLDYLEPHEAFRYLGEQVRDRILDLFTWTRGFFAFYPGVEAPSLGTSLNLKTYTLIYEGVMERVPLVVIRRALGHVDDKKAVVVGGTVPAELVLSGRDQRMVKAIESDGLTSAQLIKREGSEERILRLLYLLREVGRIDLAEPS
jgi:serine/threonine protein kinase